MPRNPITTHIQFLARDEKKTWEPREKQGLHRAMVSIDSDLTQFDAQIEALAAAGGSSVFPGVVVYGKIVELTSTPFDIPEPPELGFHVYALKNRIGTVVVNWPSSFKDAGLFQPGQSVDDFACAIFLKEAADLTYPITQMWRGSFA